MPPTRPLLYVHPYNHVLDELVPMGAVALVNRCAVPKRGVYAWELTPDMLADAGCLAMDLHWYFSIEAVRWIAQDARRIAPDLPIVLGGITASFYARHLSQTFPVDYVVQGDGEQSFPQLVEALCEGRTPPPLPNVWTKQGPPPRTGPVPGELYDDNDYLDLSWFPTLASHTREHHARWRRQPFWGEMDRYHPYIPLNRGCRFPCGVCFGSWQRDVFGTGQVDRGVASAARLLDGAVAHPDYHFVNLTGGTEDTGRMAAYRDVLRQPRPLGVYVMHFCTLPSDDDLQALLDGFERVCLDFTNPDDLPLPLRAAGLTPAQAQDRIVALCRALDGEDRVQVGVSFLSTAPDPFKDRLRQFSWERVQLKENSEWTLPRPDLRTLGQHGGVDEPDGEALLARSATLPAMPIPMVERRGMEPEQKAARDRAKAAQAEQFRDVSRAHAHYVLARGLCPALHPVLDQSYLQNADGSPVAPVHSDDAVVQAFIDAYTTRYRRWYVTTLHDVGVAVAATVDDVPRAGLFTVARMGPNLGDSRWRGAMNGIDLAWEGNAPHGVTALVVRPLLDVEPGHRLDPRQVADLPLLCLPLHGTTGPLLLRGLVSPARCTLSLSTPDGRVLSQLQWRAEDRPPSPFDAPSRPARRGPTDKLDAPWPDDHWPRRFDDALAGADLSPWRQQRLARDRDWVHHRLSHPSGAVVQVYVLPPGDAPCAWRGRHGRLLVQVEASGDDEPRFALMATLERVLAAVDGEEADSPKA